MGIKCVAVGRNMPTWVSQAFTDYNKRLPSELTIDIIEIRPEYRGDLPTNRPQKTTANPASIKPSTHSSLTTHAVSVLSGATRQLIEKEGQKILNAIPPQHRVIALDERGQAWNTLQLAEQVKTWRENQDKICLLIGGPDGLSEACRQRADRLWSLSPLTLPHPLVRVIIAEQIYRAWSILTHHPYHRG